MRRAQLGLLRMELYARLVRLHSPDIADQARASSFCSPAEPMEFGLVPTADGGDSRPNLQLIRLTAHKTFANGRAFAETSEIDVWKLKRKFRLF